MFRIASRLVGRSDPENPMNSSTSLAIPFRPAIAPPSTCMTRPSAQLAVYRTDPLATIDEALAADPTFVMGHCFKAGLLATTTERGNEAGIAAALEAAERHIGIALERERMHISCGARLAVPGLRRRRQTLRRHLRRVSARPARAADRAPVRFLLGNSTMLRDRPAQVLHAWDERDPQRGCVLGMHAFGLEECGALRRCGGHRPARAWS